MSAEGKKSNKGFIALLVMIIVCACLMIAAVTTLGIGMSNGMNGGQQGTQGEQTATGSKWTSGKGAPANTAGTDGDFYLDSDSGNVYEKKNGAWSVVLCIKAESPRISKGENGETAGNWYVGNVDQGVSALQTFDVSIDQEGYWCINGVQTTQRAYSELTIKDGYWYINDVNSNVRATAEWLTGEGAPEASKGAVGDMYLDLANGDIYKRTAAGWGSSVGNISGALGTGGSVWYTGEGEPDNGLAEGIIPTEGNYYFDVLSGDVYAYGEDGWSVEPVTNLGIPAKTPHIEVSSVDGKNHWFIGDDDTGIVAEGKDGEDGVTPRIGEDGYWIVNGEKTIYKAVGEKGENGVTPHIGTDGYWYFGEDKTEYLAVGEKGERGTLWHSGEKAPSTTAPAVGDTDHVYVPDAVLGDFYFNTTTGDIYCLTATGGAPSWGEPICNFSVRFEHDEWIVNGKRTGIFATKWYSGTGKPTISAHPGDHYLDTQNGIIYKNVTEEGSLDTNREGTEWEPLLTIRGTQWFTGKGEPVGNFGVANMKGDLYLNEDDCQIWQYNGSEWEKIDGLIIKGETGERGTRLFAGKLDPEQYFADKQGTYELGDFYFWTSKGILYTYESLEGVNTWNAVNADDPLAGTKWLSGEGKPEDNKELREALDSALVGDVYFDTENNVLYQCTEVVENKAVWEKLGVLSQARATKWFYGAYDPTAEDFDEEKHAAGAIDGDFYLQTFSAFTGRKGFKMFVREIGGWLLLVDMSSEISSEEKVEYTVPNYGTLVQFRDSVNGNMEGKDANDFSGKEVKLTGKFDVADSDFGSIGVYVGPESSDNRPFKGTFNGQNETDGEVGLFIGGLTGPLFGYVDGATIENLYLEGTYDGGVNDYTLATSNLAEGKISLLTDYFGIVDHVGEGGVTLTNVTLVLKANDGTITVHWKSDDDITVTIAPDDETSGSRPARRPVQNDAAGEQGYFLTIENLGRLELGKAKFIFKNVAFKGTTYLDVKNAESLTLDDCYVNVDPEYLTDLNKVQNTRTGFIVSGNDSSSVAALGELTVKNTTFLTAQTRGAEGATIDDFGTAIFVWRPVKNVTIENNTFGADTEDGSERYRYTAVKFLNIAENAELLFKDNTVYGSNAGGNGKYATGWEFEAFDLRQSNTANTYKATLTGNTANISATTVFPYYLAYVEGKGGAQVYLEGETNKLVVNGAGEDDGNKPEVMLKAVGTENDDSFDFIAFYATLDAENKLTAGKVYLGSNFGAGHTFGPARLAEMVQEDAKADVWIIDTAFEDPLGFTQHVADYNTNYYVNNANGLASFRNMVNEGVNNFDKMKVVQTATIDLDNALWTPIGGAGSTSEEDVKNPFKGSYDGGEFEIENLTLKATKDVYFVGLFGYVEGGTIENLTLRNVEITDEGSTAAIGAVAGAAKAKFTNVTVIGDIDIQVHGSYVGGVVGNSHGSSFASIVIGSENQVNNVISSTNPEAYLGGISGYSAESVGDGEAEAEVVHTATLWNLRLSAPANLGGLFGLLNGGNTVNEATLTNVKIVETQVGNNKKVGAVAGVVKGSEAGLSLTKVKVTGSFAHIEAVPELTSGETLPCPESASLALYNNGWVGGFESGESVTVTANNECSINVQLNMGVWNSRSAADGYTTDYTIIDSGLFFELGVEKDVYNNGVYKITTARALNGFSKMVTHETLAADTTGMDVVLTGDITITKFVDYGNPFDETIGETKYSGKYEIKSSFAPIGSEGNPFKGTFDGGNKTITGLTSALFGHTGEGASIHDLNLEGVKIESKENTVGALVASATGTTIQDITVSGSVVSEGNNVGALVGELSGTELNASKVSNVTVSGTVSGGYNVGGLVGVSKGTTSIADATVTADVTKTDEGDAAHARSIGGLVGAAEDGLTVRSITINGTIDNQYAAENLNYLVYNYGLVGSTVKDTYATDEWATGKEVLAPANFAFEGVTVPQFTASVDVHVKATDLDLTATFSARKGGKQAYGVLVTAATAKGLNSVAELVNHGITFEGETVMLGADVALTDKEANAWTPIGDSAHAFKGTFTGGTEDYETQEVDGSIHSITHLGKALFGALDGATVKHLVLNEVLLTSTDTFKAPALVAYSAKNATIKDIVVNGFTQTTEADETVAKANDVAAAPYGVVGGTLDDTNTITDVDVTIEFKKENVTFTAEVDKDSNSKLVYTGDTLTDGEKTSEHNYTAIVDGEIFNLSGFEGKTTLGVTFTGIKFTGNSYVEIRNTTSFTMKNCYAAVAPDDSAQGREAFIRSSTVGSKGIKLDIKDNVIIIKSSADQYAPAIFVLWNPIQSGSVISGNTIGDDTHRHSFAAVKLGDFAENAVVTIEGNTVYGGDGYWFCAFDFFQTADNAKYAYTVNLKSNTVNFKTEKNAQPGGDTGEYCFAYVESSETTQSLAKIFVGADNTIVYNGAEGRNVGYADVCNWVKADSENVQNAYFIGYNVVWNDDGKVTSGDFVLGQDAYLLHRGNEYIEMKGDAKLLEEAVGVLKGCVADGSKENIHIVIGDDFGRRLSDFYDGETYTESNTYYIFSSVGFESFFDLQNHGFDFQGKLIEFSEEFSAEIVKDGGEAHTLDLGALATKLGMTAWTPIGTEEKPFQGTFDGSFGDGNWQIKGLTSAANAQYVGLFGRTDGATLKNLDLAAELTLSESVPNRYTGLLVAYGIDTVIDNVNVSGSNLTGPIGIAGAVAGYLKGGSVSNVKVTSTTILADSGNVGAVVGRANGGKYSAIYVGGSMEQVEEEVKFVADKDPVTVQGTLSVGGVIGNAEGNVTVGAANTSAADVVGNTQYNGVYSAAAVKAVSMVTNKDLQIGGVIGSVTQPADESGVATGDTTEINVTNAQFIGSFERKGFGVKVSTKYANYGLVGGDTEKATSKVSITDSYLSVVHDENGQFVQVTNWSGAEVISEYQITGVEGFKFFRDQVNGGNSYGELRVEDGKSTFHRETIHLMADIPLNNEEWEPIGYDETKYANGTDVKAVFEGVFTGKKTADPKDDEAYTISALQVLGHNAHENEADVNGYGMGLFGRTHEAEIKYLNINGAKVTGHSAVGTLIGIAKATVVDHVNVENATVEGHEFVGGLIGHNDGNMGVYTLHDSSITNCTVKTLTALAVPEAGVDTEGNMHFKNGLMVGGLVGFNIATSFDGNTVDGATLKAYKDIGGLVGIDNTGESPKEYKNNTVKGVEITTVREGFTESCDGLAGYTKEYQHIEVDEPQNINWMVGRLQADVTPETAAKFGVNVEGGEFNNVKAEGTSVVHTAPASAKGLIKERDAWYILSTEGLDTFRSLVNEGKTTHNGKDLKAGFAGETVALECDVNFIATVAVAAKNGRGARFIDNTVEWAPIGTEDNPFKGTFNGLGHTITGLTISKGDNVGFFGYIKGEGDNTAGVKNLTLKDVNVTGGTNVGTLAGSVSGTTISNVTVKSETEVTGKANVGGLVGTVAKGGAVVLEDVTVNVDVTDTNDAAAMTSSVGGLVGNNGAGSSLSIEGSAYEGKITLPKSVAEEELPKHAFVGNYNDENKPTVKDSASEVTNVTGAENGFYEGQAASKDGIVHTGYLINSAAGLKHFATLVNESKDFAGEYVFLTADIDLSTLKGEAWTPIGTETHRFMGTFDGKDHKISNITVSGEKYVGLFGLVGLNEAEPTECEIKNLKIGGVNTVTVNGTAHNARNDSGLLVGYAANVAFSNITVLADASVTVTGVPADGIYGPNAVGGLVGASQSCTYDTIKTECAVIRVNNAGGIMVGGIIGLSMHDELSNFDIKNTWVDGNFAVGGLIGTAFGRESLQNVHVGGNVYMNYWWYYSNLATSEYYKMIGGLIGSAELDQADDVLTIEGSSFNGSLVRVNAYYDEQTTPHLYELSEPLNNGLVGRETNGAKAVPVSIKNTSVTVMTASSAIIDDKYVSLYGKVDAELNVTYDAEGEFTPVEG